MAVSSPGIAAVIETGDVVFRPAGSLPAPDNNLGDLYVIARNANGTVLVNSGSTIDMTRNLNEPAPDPAGAFLAVGRGPGVTGELTVSDAGSAINIDSQDSISTVQIGREGVGVVTIENGGQLNLLDPLATIGTGGTTGESIFVGRNGGIGEMNIDAGQITIDSRSSAFFFLGRAGGTGTVNVENGGTLTLRDRSTDANDAGTAMILGHGGGGKNDFNLPVAAQGTLHVDGGTVEVLADAADASVSVGRDQGTMGTATLSNGGTLRAASNSGGSHLMVGAAFANFGRPNGGTGSLTVTGTGSTAQAGTDIIVGAPIQFGGGTSSGQVVVSNGGSIIAPQIYVGTGGHLSGSGGTVTGNVVLDGGTVAPGTSPGTMDINGDLLLQNGLLEFEIGGTAPGMFDVLNVNGDVIANATTQISVSFINGFAPKTGDVFDFLNVQGDFSTLSANITAPDLIIGGLEPGAAFALHVGPGSFGVETLNDGVSTTGAVPLPATLPLLAGGLAGLVLLRRRR